MKIVIHPSFDIINIQTTVLIILTGKGCGYCV